MSYVTNAQYQEQSSLCQKHGPVPAVPTLWLFLLYFFFPVSDWTDMLVHQCAAEKKHLPVHSSLFTAEFASHCYVPVRNGKLQTSISSLLCSMQGLLTKNNCVSVPGA